MSPIPPNKEYNHKSFNNSTSNQSDDTFNTNNIPLEPQVQVDDEYEIINNEANGNNENNTQNQYETISQNPNEASPIDEEETDEDDDDSESDNEPDPETAFEMLASSRAFTLNERKNTSYDRNEYLFETDYFERKNVLQCEDIHIDEEKSKQINSLMSNFKLPDSSVPEWAKLVPEDIWKKNLMDSLIAKKTDLFDLKKNDANQN